MPMIGQPTIATHSISRATLRPNISPTEPWNTVWSWLNTPTGRPLMVPCPVTTPSPKSAFGITRRLASAPISRKVPGSSSAWMRARALGMPFFVPLGDGLLAAGFLGQLQLLAKLGQQFSAVVWLGGGRLRLLSPRSLLLGLDPVDRLAHVRADLSDERLVDRLDVLTPDRHHLEIGHELAPAAVRLAGGVAGFERDGVVVIAVGHVQRDMPVVGLDLGGVDGPVVQVRRALVLDDAAGDLHPALFHGVEDELHLTGVVEFLELLVRDLRDLHVERPLGELRVAVPAGAGLLLGLGDLLARAHRVDEPDELHVGTGLLEPDGAGVGQHPTQRPARQHERLAAVHLQQLRHVLGRALLDGSLDPLEPVHRGARAAAG